MDERRQSDRRRARTFAWCDGPAGTFYGAVHDASDRGVFLRMGPDLSPGTPLRLTMDAIPQGPVIALGEVVWRREGSPNTAPGVGVRLERFVKGEHVWNRFLRARRRSPSSPDLFAVPSGATPDRPGKP